MCQKAVIDVSTIQFLPEFMTRAQAVDPETVERYRGVIDLLPGIKVWQHPQSGQILLLDGRHTLEAHRAEDRPQVEVIFVEGDYDDALVRSRSSNLSHGRPYSRAEWRQAVIDIVKIRYLCTNARIAREAGCSGPTIARIRAELEAAGDIPCLAYLEAEDGRLVQRQAKEAEAQPERVAEESAAEEVAGDEEEQAQAGVEQTPAGKKEKPPADRDGFDEDPRPGEPVKVTLKLGCLGEPLAVEVGLWLEGNLEPIPATLLITANQPKGLEEAAPGHTNCLIIHEALARSLKLLIE